MYTVHFAPAVPRGTRRMIRVILLTAVLALSTLSVIAQPRVLQSGVGTVGAIDASNPLSFFVFSGIEGEIITVGLFGITPDFIPTLTVLSPSQQPIASSGGVDGVVTLAAVLPADGSYTILVGSGDNRHGEFALRVDGGATGQIFPMFADEQLRVNVTAGGAAQILRFEAGQAGFALQLGSIFAAETGARFNAQVIASNGGRLAAYNGIYGALTMIPADAGQVYIVLSGAGVGGDGGVDVVLHTGGALNLAEGSGTPQTQTVTTPDGSGAAPVGACTIVAGPNGVNVRGGDGTDFAVIGQVEPNGVRPAIGRNANSTWFAISTGGATGWVAAQVVTATGDCSALPVLSSTARPNPTAAPQIQPTTPGQPTATTEGQQPPVQPTATTAPESPAAPADAGTHRFEVHRDNGGSFSEVISYPNGDTSDRIEMSVNLSQGDSRVVTLTLNCNGNNTQNVRFAVTNPNLNRVGCGQSITERYNAERRTGYYYVFIEDGGAAYVNYTLVATTSN